MTKLNYLDAEEMEGWLKDRLDDAEATWQPRNGKPAPCDPYAIDADEAARHIISSLEDEGLAILPTDSQWPPTLSFRLGDKVTYSTCGGPSCHKIRATVVGWFKHTTQAGYGYVIAYGSTTQVVRGARLEKYNG